MMRVLSVSLKITQKGETEVKERERGKRRGSG